MRQEDLDALVEKNKLTLKAMKKQTAVEWLKEQLKENMLTTAKELDELFEQAKAMEKEQIIEAHFEGQANQDEGYPIQISQQYYNETYEK